jgi:hypothetical protein
MLQSFGKIGQAYDDKKDSKFQYSSGSALHTVEEDKKHNKSVENNGGNNYNLQNINQNKRGIKRVKSANVTRKCDTTGRLKKGHFLST